MHKYAYPPPLPAPNLYSNFTSCSNNISKEKHTRPRHIFPFNHYSNSNSMQKGGGGRGWGGRVLLFSATVLASTGLKPDSLLVTRGIVKSCMCLQYCKRAIMRFQNLVRILFPEMSPFFPILWAHFKGGIAVNRSFVSTELLWAASQGSYDWVLLHIGF